MKKFNLMKLLTFATLIAIACILSLALIVIISEANPKCIEPVPFDITTGTVIKNEKEC